MAQIKIIIPWNPEKKMGEMKNKIQAAYIENGKGVYFASEWSIGIAIKAYYSKQGKPHSESKESTGKGMQRPKENPNCTKIMKTVSKSLKKIAFADEKQVVVHVIEKCYAREPRIEITIWQLAQDSEAS